MIDSFGRNVNYLRISVTDRCNLRCVYCMPDEGMTWLKRSELLTYEEICRIVRVMAELGLSKVRFTGGEPLVRSDLPELVKEISVIKGIDDISLSTNAVLLDKYAVRLKEAGIQRVNISLDTLDAEKFLKISLRHTLEDVLNGIKAAEDVGMKPIKINMVVMKGVNDDELAEFASLTLTKDYTIRFIEMMPLKENLDRQEISYLSTEKIKKAISGVGELIPLERDISGGPARNYKIKGAKGKLGFISPLSHTFCADCNRMRLTATGGLKLCLFNEPELNFRDPMRNGATDDDLKLMIRDALIIKPLEHNLQVGKAGFESYTAMSQIGG
ncbi:GTP 3',8-cyclase MoaA [Candidatus Marinimicrobia bacterium MT.SAG.3]|nr:GTP 3',8-cyclase MoaA [Candidatus Marinimicrobia bacterium MT.SAG.3]TFB13337.1 GTP 3',8-cyclase MoaA [Candidatus Marinimicrobia bacterium MT.SAG.4]